MGRHRQAVEAPNSAVVADNEDERDPDENEKAKAETPAQETKRAEENQLSKKCRRCLSSPPFKIFIFCIIAAVPVFGITCVLPTLLEKQQCTSFLCKLRHWFISLWLAAQFLYNFAASQWTDAGGTVKHKPPYEATGQFELNTTHDGLKSDKDSEDIAILFAPNWCEKCSHWKPPRSHHCRMCGKCVLQMDHHCPFTGNCIGMRNHGHFILMYIFAIVGLTYCLSMCVLAVDWSMSVKSPTGMLRDINKNLPMWSPGIAGIATSIALRLFIAAGIEVGMLMVGAIVALIAVLSFGTPAIWMAASGMTIIENQFPMKEYVQIKPQVYCPLGPGFYRRSFFQNLGTIFGPQWRLRLLCPTRGGTLDATPGIC